MSISIKSVISISLPLICVPLFAFGWRQPTSEPLQEPKEPPLHKLEFTGPEEPWPPRPKGQTNIKEIVSKEIPGSLDDALEERIRSAAVADTRVRALLGTRFAYIGTEEIDPDKARPRGPSDPLVTRVTFYNYTNKTAVEVQVRGVSVATAAARKDYQPPEGPDEVREAVALAQQDPRLRDKLAGLQDINGILVEVPQGTPGYGNRVIEVFFGQENEDLPAYHALVDLTVRRVLVAEALGAPLARRKP